LDRAMQFSKSKRLALAGARQKSLQSPRP